ncbi:alpha/beta hydrolase fold domain-containing protein [Pedobacter sp. ISL-68]|uniref:alpha/beta hydrolase n=1 Tax=unclassified Pedobacter TaxID=2628915 RepID=UPI001BED19C1|nr:MULTISPECIES: alpha/beta hydrolase [unclassified Pedobacter]MBT2560165.1 alpha/beta hydrolase fold domain-containing protein [Pedobacter sp. ISL-64]MBT2589144.1 alpha/beta hydrolase fold domain-containing protein [Pedobacter sp. ISL-68]
MQLSSQVQQALTYIGSIEIEGKINPWEKGREFYEKFIPLAGEKEAVFKIENIAIQGETDQIKLRIYRPSEQDNLPVIVYFHGGWFNSGDLETHDTPLRRLSNLSKAIIIAVDYRLAPEHPFPAGLNDGMIALEWLFENAAAINVDPNKVSLAGDSAGGALVAALTGKFAAKINCQLLIYPVTDCSLTTGSWEMFKDGPLLDAKSGAQAWKWYLSNANDSFNPDAVPLLQTRFCGLPPTFVATAEYDPLRDEGMMYGEKLKQNGVSVTELTYGGMIHGFFQMGGVIDQSDTLMGDMVKFFTQHSA